MTEEFLELNNYKKQKKIGQGGFSEVYRIIEKGTGNIYAAKVSLKEINPKSRKEMLNISREVNIISKLVHPCILRFIGYSPFDFNHDSKPVIVTEYSQNGSLEKILELERSGRSLPEWDQTKKLVVIYGIAAGMAYLHLHDIIHRDLKPDNIFLDEYLLPKIADFGLSKFNKGSRTALTSIDTPSGIKGTPAYIAPEIWGDADNNVRYSKACDVYSFSLIVYEIVTSIIPFEKYTMIQLMRKVAIKGERPEFKCPVPDSYRRLIEDCWAQKPSKRPSFQEIVDQLTSDPGFISEGVERDDFLDYVEYINESLSLFKSSRKIIHFSDIVNPFSKSFKKVKLYASPPASPLASPRVDKSPKRSPSKDKSPEKSLIYPEKEFTQLNSSCQRLVREANEDEEKQFIVGKSIFEGTIGFPKNLELGIMYLKKAIKNGSIDATIYYCRILIEGKLVPPNPEKAEKYLFLYYHRKIPTIYTLIGKAKIVERNYSDAIKYFKKSSSLGNAEAMYEYGVMFLNGEGVPRDEAKANQYIEMAKQNGYLHEEKIKIDGNRNNPDTIIVTPSIFNKLDESCQNSVRSAELGEETALVYVARGFLEGSNGFPHKNKLGCKFLKYGLKLKNVEAMQLYGSFFLNGNFVPKNEEKGISILNEAATLLNSTDMKLQLVNILLSKQNFDVHSTDNNNTNFPLAKKYCKEAADSGNTKAMVLYAILCMKEKKNKHGAIYSDFKEAFKYFRQASENGNGEGMALYGRFLDHGYGIERPNKEEAFNYYERSYEEGDMTGYTFYGSFLIEGAESMPRNESEGLRLVKYSCDQGNAYGMANYGYFLSKGLSILKKDVNQSIRYYKMAADLGCPVAYSNLGVCYRDGAGIKKDVKLAIKYFKIAMEEGYPRSAFLLGNLLINGDEESSLKPDLKEGYKYIQYAADHGNCSAMYMFAYYMYYRKGIEMNANLLRKYLLNGIDYGHPGCMRLFGKILMNGDILPEDKYQGVRYIKKAVDLGDGKAMELYADALENGEGVMKNIELAQRYREMALHASKKI